MAEEKKVPPTFVRKASGLVREMGVTDIMVFIMAPVMGGGICYYVCTIAGEAPGANIPLVFLIVGLLHFPYITTIGVLSAAMPRSGGMFVPISRTLHPALGFIGGWLTYLALGMIIGIICSVSALLLGVAFLISGVGVGVGKWLTTHVLSMGVLIAVIAWAIQLSGIKILRYITKITVILPSIALIIIWILLTITGPAGAMTAFNAKFGAGAWDKLLGAAGDAGWTFPAISLGALGGGLVAAMWSYQGTLCCTFFGGEMKTMGRKITGSFMGGFALVILGYTLTAALIYWCFGGIIAPQGFLKVNAPDALGGVLGSPTGPSVPFYIGLLISPGVALAITLLITLWVLNGILPIFASTSRILFSLSFDRAIPSKLAEVSRRGAPTWATHITLGVAIIGCFIFHYGIRVVLGTSIFPLCVMILLFGISAMIMPFIRPELFDRAPIKSKTLMVGLGTYTTFFGAFCLLVCALEMTTGMAIYMSALLSVGMVIYTYQQSKNIEKGVDISKIYKEIPPG